MCVLKQDNQSHDVDNDSEGPTCIVVSNYSCVHNAAVSAQVMLYSFEKEVARQPLYQLTHCYTQ